MGQHLSLAAHCFSFFYWKLGGTPCRRKICKGTLQSTHAMKMYFHERNLKLFANQWYFLSVALTGALIQTRACSTAPNKGIADLWKWSCWEKFEDALRWREVWLPELDHVLQIPFSMQSNRLVTKKFSLGTAKSPRSSQFLKKKTSANGNPRNPVDQLIPAEKLEEKCFNCRCTRIKDPQVDLGLFCFYHWSLFQRTFNFKTAFASVVQTGGHIKTNVFSIARKWDVLRGPLVWL